MVDHQAEKAAILDKCCQSVECLARGEVMDLPDRTSPVTESVMTTYSDLPAAIQKHLLELEVFIGDCDGQWTALQTSDEKVVLDNGTIDASDAVKAFNGIVAALRTFVFAQKPQEPHEATYLRGWNEGIERAAEVADAARGSAKEHHGVEASIVADIAARRIRALAVTSPDREPK